jgi:hypothetical protein
MALRVSIGAGRGRLVQLVLVESAWLGISWPRPSALYSPWWSAPFIVGMTNPAAYPARLVLPADWRVLGFGLALASGVTLLFGLIPALRASAVKPSVALRGGEDPHSRRRLMHALIAVQVAFCFVVHFTAGLLVSSFRPAGASTVGFSAERILNLEAVTQRPQPPVFWTRWPITCAQCRAWKRSRLNRMAAAERGEARWEIFRSNGAPPTDVFSDFVSVSPGLG